MITGLDYVRTVHSQPSSAKDVDSVSHVLQHWHQSTWRQLAAAAAHLTTTTPLMPFTRNAPLTESGCSQGMALPAATVPDSAGRLSPRFQAMFASPTAAATAPQVPWNFRSNPFHSVMFGMTSPGSADLAEVTSSSRPCTSIESHSRSSPRDMQLHNQNKAMPKTEHGYDDEDDDVGEDNDDDVSG